MSRLAFVLCFASSAVLANDAKIPDSEFTPAGHTTDPLEIVHQRIKSKQCVLLDVREQAEWDAGHLKLAKLVPLSAVKKNQLTADMKKHLPMDKPIYLHCGAGVRVLAVSEVLRAQGYDIRPLRSGYDKLTMVGFEIATPNDDASSPAP